MSRHVLSVLLGDAMSTTDTDGDEALSSSCDRLPVALDAVLLGGFFCSLWSDCDPASSSEAEDSVDKSSSERWSGSMVMFNLSAPCARKQCKR
jgi:hypothetical protein